MKRRKVNLNNYVPLDIKATEEEIREIVGDDLLIRNRKKYIPKDICIKNQFKLGRRYGETNWCDALLTRED